MELRWRGSAVAFRNSLGWVKSFLRLKLNNRKFTLEQCRKSALVRYAVPIMTADEVKHLLQLEPLQAEGGFFRETYRSRRTVPEEYLPGGMRSPRSIGTAIYFMLTRESFSAQHRLPGTEIFHFYLGDPVIMLQLLPDGTSQTITLGPDLAGGQRPQVVVRGGVWQGSRLAPGGKFALLGTTMSPGFDYADFELGDREQLMAQYPGAAEMIRRFTR